jgi:hypothetical protein
MDVDDEGSSPVHDDPIVNVATTVAAAPTAKKKRKRMRVVCDKCHKEVQKKSLATHQQSGRCRLVCVEMALARADVARELDEVEPAPNTDEKETKTPPARFFKPRLSRAKPQLPSVTVESVAPLRAWLTSVAHMAPATTNDVIAALRKILAHRYGANHECTLEKVYFGLIDTTNFQRFMATLEANGLKATSRKRYTEAIRQGLLWLETQPRDVPGVQVPTVEAISAMRATIVVNKKGLSRKARQQKAHLSYDGLLESGQMLLAGEVGPLLTETAREFVALVEGCNKSVPTQAQACRAQKLLVTLMALGTGVAVRGGDFANLTLVHIDEAINKHTMTLLSHKTSGTHGPLVIPVPNWLGYMLQRWRLYFRPQLVNPDHQSQAIFLTCSGKRLNNITQVLLTPYIEEKTGKHITFTTIRKFMETESFNNFDTATQKLVSHGQGHSDATAEAYYKLRQGGKAAAAAHQAFDRHLGLSAAVAKELPPGVAAPPAPAAAAVAVAVVMDVAAPAPAAPTNVDDAASEDDDLVLSPVVIERAPAPAARVRDDDADPDENDAAMARRLADRMLSPPATDDEDEGEAEDADDDDAPPLPAPASKAPSPAPQPTPMPLETKVPESSTRKRRGWDPEQVKYLLNALAAWEATSEDAGTVPWNKLRMEGGALLDSKTPMQIKDKLRVLSKQELAQLNTFRDARKVPSELRRAYARKERKGKTAVHVRSLKKYIGTDVHD